MPRCTRKRHNKLAKQRIASAKYYRKHRAEQNARAKAYYRKNRRSVLAAKKASRTAEGVSQTQALRLKYGGSRGRPRTC